MEQRDVVVVAAGPGESFAAALSLSILIQGCFTVAVADLLLSASWGKSHISCGLYRALKKEGRKKERQFFLSARSFLFLSQMSAATFEVSLSLLPSSNIYLPTSYAFNENHISLLSPSPLLLHTCCFPKVSLKKNRWWTSSAASPSLPPPPSSSLAKDFTKGKKKA